MPAKTRYLTVFLLQPEIREFEEAIDSTRPLEQHELRDDLPFEGRLYIEPRAPSVPSWLRFVADGVDGDVGDYLNSSTAAVLLFRVEDRILALTFGFGRNLLADGSYELDFGLKVALNTVNADRLRSVEIKVVEEMVLNRRVQASRGTSPGTFGLDTGRDILRAVTGEPDDTTLAKRVTGADALAIATKVELDEVGLLGERLIEAYQDTRYQQRFSWIDHVRVVRGREVTDELNARLLQDLRSSTADLLYLAPPELLDWSNLGGFIYTRGDPSAPHLELDLMDYLVNVDVDELDVDDLKRHRVKAMAADTGESRDEWSVYKCLVYETRHDGGVYLLSEGRWFAVARDFSEEVRERVARIPIADLNLPAALEGEWERTYNERAVAGKTDVALLDRQLAQVARERGPIELCDLFTEERQFVHVKRKTHSATLSHLFAQGSVAAEAFRQDDGVRDQARAILNDTHPNLAALINRPQPEEFEVVYGIIAADSNRLPGSLPFFSRLNLLSHVDRLRMLDYKVSVLGIPLVAARAIGRS